MHNCLSFIYSFRVSIFLRRREPAVALRAACRHLSPHASLHVRSMSLQMHTIRNTSKVKYSSQIKMTSYVWKLLLTSKR